MFYVMKQYKDEYGAMMVMAARVAPYKTEEKAKKKMHKIGKGAFVDASAIVLHDVPPFFEFSRKGFLYKIRRDYMRSLGIDEAEIKRYDEKLSFVPGVIHIGLFQSRLS